MGFRRVAAAAAVQAALLGCGVALTLELQAHLFAVAAALGLAALWIVAAVAWSRRLRAALPVERPRELARDAAQARLLASLLDQTPAPLLTLDETGSLRARNRVARQLFRTDDLILKPPQALIEALEAQAPGARRTARVEGRAYVVSLSDVWAVQGRLRLAALHDIEPELRAAEARALRELMQVLSHEIMNGITPVASLAVTAEELLAEGGAAARLQAREALSVLSRRAEGLARFAEGYRALARLPPPVLAATSAAALIEEAAQLFRGQWFERGVTLLAVAPSPDVEAPLDRDQLIHALLNLLANAAEAALAAPAPFVVELRGEGRRPGLVIRVADSGQGIDGPAREHVFQPFFTTKPHGTGVGLSLSRQIARAHGGELELLPTEAGRGAVFEFRVGIG